MLPLRNIIFPTILLPLLHLLCPIFTYLPPLYFPPMMILLFLLIPFFLQQLLLHLLLLLVTLLTHLLLLLPLLCPQLLILLFLLQSLTLLLLSLSLIVDLSQPPPLPLRKSTRPHKSPSHLNDFVCDTAHWCNLVHFDSLPADHQTFFGSQSTWVEPRTYKQATQDPN